MARKLPKKDVAIIGLGWTGSILANELTDEGLDVVAIERGPWRDAPTDYPTTFDQDELRYRIRHELFLRPAQLTFTFRNKMDQQALPIRSWGAFMPMNGVGGGGVHWNAETFRFLPSDFVAQDASDATIWCEFSPRRHDDPGLWRHLRRSRAALRPIRISLRDVWSRGQSQRTNPRRRQSVRGAALAALPQSATGAAVQPHPVRQGRARARLQAVSAAVRQHVAGLCEPARRPARTLHLLRLLRMVRLRQLFQGQPADDHSSCSGQEIELQLPHRLRGDAHQCRRLRQAGDRRHLRRYQRRGVGTAGRPRDPRRVHRLQRSAPAHVRHWQTLRSGRQSRGDRPQLHPPDDLRRDRIFRQGEIQLQSVHRLRLDRHDHRRVQRRQFRSWALGLRRRRIHGAGADGRASDSNDSRSARHAPLGGKVEERGAGQLSEHGDARHRRARELLLLSRRLSRPRPALSRTGSAVRWCG